MRDLGDDVPSELTHVDEQGRAAMVDVGGKEPTARRTEAEGFVTMARHTRELLFDGGLPKGDALAVARVAAIQGAKRTAELIPLCHPLPIDAIEVEIEPTEDGARIFVAVAVVARTGVEMEAMTGVAVGAVTLYDMVKGIDRGASIGPIRLLTKSGGRSGTWRRE